MPLTSLVLGTMSTDARWGLRRQMSRSKTKVSGPQS